MSVQAACRLGKLAPASSALFVCDIQERFRPVISGMPAVIDGAKRLVRASNVLNVPVLVTEQYPKALGATVSEIKEVLKPAAPIVAKTRFSMITREVQTFLESHKAIKQVMLVGIEAHVCVLQTTLDLLEQGYEVHLVVDAVSSQKLLDRGVGLQRAVQSGAFLTSQEMVMFQLAGDAKHPGFKEISGLAKEARPDAISMLQLSSML